MERGETVRTVFLARYLHDRPLRAEINDGLNVIEQWNFANDFIFFPPRRGVERPARGPGGEHAQPPPAPELHGLRQHAHDPEGARPAEMERTAGGAVLLADLRLRADERFTYTYNYSAGWEHELRVEAVGPAQLRRRYPRCVGGQRPCLPEWCARPRGAGRDQGRPAGPELCRGPGPHGRVRPAPSWTRARARCAMRWTRWARTSCGWRLPGGGARCCWPSSTGGVQTGS